MNGNAIAGAVLLAMAGCASLPAPTEQLALANAEVSQAQSAGSAEYAPVELRTAQSKLEQAQRAMQNKDYLQAKRWAEEAEVDAKLARTKTQSAKAQKTVAELQEGIRVLQTEIQRKTR